MPELNPQQRGAVREVQSPLLVLAGAGSGKTRVITEKIAYLIEQCGMPAKTIVAVTFTNKAAREMRERVSRLLSKDAGRGLVVSTFHTLGMRILRREATGLGYKSNFSIFDSQDSLHLIDELLRKRTGAFAPDALRNQISHWKNELVLPLLAVKQATTEFETAAALLFAEYQRNLKAYNALDFDDLILQPVVALQDNEKVREHWQNRVRHLLVDEYQDTNSAQYRLVQLLVGTTTPFTAVGDDDQSIYAWRGANPENLQRLKDDFPRLTVIKLEQNYRSAGCILKCANQLIANNPHLFEKRLWSSLGYGSQLKVMACRDGDHEAERVVSEILHHQFTHATRHGEYAILYRGNHQSRGFEKVLREHSIAYHLSGGTSFFARNEVKDIMAYLRLILNENDDNAFLRIANVPRRKLGASTLEALGNFANTQRCSLSQACTRIGPDSIPEAGLKRLREFRGWMSSVRSNCQSDAGVSGIRQMIRDMEYEDWLMQLSSSEDVAERRMANVDFLVESLGRVMSSEQVPLDEAISRLVLRDLLEQQDEEDTGPDSVQLMTLHAAKGLEFPHVYIIGMEENLLPHRVSIEEENIAEERRLAYVGITRAQQTLAMTLALKRRQFGETINCEPSRFIAELPQDDLQWQGGGADTEEANEERGQETLAGLKNLFA